MKKYKNSKIFISMSVISAVIVVSVVIIASKGLKNNVSSEDDFRINTSKDILDSNPNSLTHPIMHDYVYSTIGHKSDINAKSFGQSYAIMVNNKFIESETDSGVIHILKIVPSDYFPPVSTGHVSIEMSGVDWEASANAFRSWPKKNKFEEGEYGLYILTESTGEKSSFNYKSSPDGTIWNGINLANLDYPEGWLSENIDKGWSTEWVRKEPYYSQIKRTYGIDLKSEFFDKFRIHEVIEVESKDSEYNTKRIKVAGEDHFIVLDPPVWEMGLEQLNLQLNEEGYNKIDR